MFGVLKTAMQSTICQLFNIIIVPENTFSLVKAYILHITSIELPDFYVVSLFCEGNI